MANDRWKTAARGKKKRSRQTLHQTDKKKIRMGGAMGREHLKEAWNPKEKTGGGKGIYKKQVDTLRLRPEEGKETKPLGHLSP